MSNKILKVKNQTIADVMGALNYPLPFPEGRTRERFLIVLREKAAPIEKSRMEMIEKLGEREKNGRLKFIDGHYQFGKKINQFTAAFQELMAEESIIDLNHSIMNDLPKIKTLLENSTIPLDSNQTSNVYEFVDQLEKVLSKKSTEKEEPKKKEVKKKK